MSVVLLNEFLQLKKQQYFSADRLENVQLSKLRRQVERAWSFSPFYRELYRSFGFEPGDLHSLADLKSLPVIRKSELVAAGESAFCSDMLGAGCLRLSTSGSSGQPISLPFTKHDKAHRVLKELRALMANGYRPHEKMMIIIAPSDMVKKQPMIQKMGLLRRYYMSVFEDESEQIARIKSLQPDVIYSYTSTLRILAERILKCGHDIPKPKCLVTAAEVLEPSARELLKVAFGVEPIDFYGSMEFGWIGWQCREHSGYHINADCLIVECLQDGRRVGPGEEGELVITNLHSCAAPLIRYSIGDTGVMSSDSCSCGCSLPMLERVGGRLADCIVLPSGRRLTPYKVTCAVEGVPGVRQFQVVQEAQDTIRLKLLKSAFPPDIHQVSAAVVKALGEPVKVLIDLVSVLDREPNGKFKVVKSLVRPDAPSAKCELEKVHL